MPLRCSASYEIAPLLLASLGAFVTAINIDPDGQNINLACGSLHPEGLQEIVRVTQSNLGIAYKNIYLAYQLRG